MTQFDAVANPMSNAFTDRPHYTPYTARIPAQSLDEKNTRNAPMAAISAKLNFTAADRVPDDLLNEIIWQSVRGAGSSRPAPHTRFGQAKSHGADRDDD